MLAASHAIAPFTPLLMLIGIIISMFSLIANYPAFKRWISELEQDIQKAVEAIENFLREFFDGYLEPGNA